LANRLQAACGGARFRISCRRCHQCRRADGRQALVPGVAPVPCAGSHHGPCSAQHSSGLGARTGGIEHFFARQFHQAHDGRVESARIAQLNTRGCNQAHRRSACTAEVGRAHGSRVGRRIATRSSCSAGLLGYATSMKSRQWTLPVASSREEPAYHPMIVRAFGHSFSAPYARAPDVSSQTFPLPPCCGTAPQSRRAPLAADPSTPSNPDQGPAMSYTPAGKPTISPGISPGPEHCVRARHRPAPVALRSAFSSCGGFAGIAAARP